MKNIFFVLIVQLVFVSSNIFSQDADSLDQYDSTIDSSIPELSNMHDVIHPMWHDAYPNKDYDKLKELLPLIKTNAEQMDSVQLPQILNEKKDVWDNRVRNLNNSVDKYSSAIEENDEDKLLQAAEELHSNYELLVRIVTPVTKEIDKFHKKLFQIYYQYLNNNETEKLNSAIDDLVVLADSLKNCTLPNWAMDKKGDFILAADNLYGSTINLQNLKNSNADIDKIEEAVEQVQNNYTKIEYLFEQ